MARVTLTDKYIKSDTRVPETGRADYFDALVPGLALRVSASGHRSFALVARYPGSSNPTRRAIGEYGAVTLDAARQTARDWLALLIKGVDPKVEAERQRAAARRAQNNTFGHIAEEFLRRYVKGQAWCELERLAVEQHTAQPKAKPSTLLRQVLADPKYKELVARSKREGLVKKQAADSIIRRELIKKWNKRPAADILPEECASLIREIVDRGTPEQARTTFEWLRRLFNWAVGVNEFGLVTSPVVALRPSDLIGRKVAKDRILTNDELRAVWTACDEVGHPYGPAIRMLILTGQRLREVANAPLAEFDLANKVWVIDGGRMKGDHGVHLVPLAPDVTRLLEGQPQFAGGQFAFSTDGRRPVNGWSRAKERLDKLSKVEDWTLHDIRRTMRSHLSALPIEEHVREMMIGHKIGGIKAVYDRHLYEAEKRAGFELWENRLRGILVPKPPAEVADLVEERGRRGAA